MNWLLLLLLAAPSLALPMDESNPPAAVDNPPVNVGTPPAVVGKSPLHLAALDNDVLGHIAFLAADTDSKKFLELSIKSADLGFNDEEKAELGLLKKELTMLLKQEQHAVLNDEEQIRFHQQLKDNLKEFINPTVVQDAFQKAQQECQGRDKSQYVDDMAEQLKNLLKDHVEFPSRIEKAVKDAGQKTSRLERAIRQNFVRAVQHLVRFARYYRKNELAELFLRLPRSQRSRAVQAMIDAISEKEFFKHVAFHLNSAVADPKHQERFVM